MTYTLQEKYDKIKEALLLSESQNPVELVKDLMHRDFIDIHGPEHHFLDGAAFLTAFKNAGGELDLPAALDLLASRTVKMPGAICGNWGVCGAVASVGAAMSIIHKTGPLTDNEHYKEHMQYTSRAINEMSRIGGPRCCKRNGFLAVILGARFLNETYGTDLSVTFGSCDFAPHNKQCIGARCPFYGNKSKL